MLLNRTMNLEFFVTIAVLIVSLSGCGIHATPVEAPAVISNPNNVQAIPPAPLADSVLKLPVLVALGSAINQLHSGTCTLPSKPSDVHSLCTGALAAVTVPTIQTVSCYFDFQIICPGNDITEVTGTRIIYELIMPNGQISQTIANMRRNTLSYTC
jgi:hypothetical protein